MTLPMWLDDGLLRLNKIKSFNSSISVNIKVILRSVYMFRVLMFSLDNYILQKHYVSVQNILLKV